MTMETISDIGVTESGRPSRVVVLVDASPQALHALELAAALARHHRVPLLAVSVEEPDRERSLAYGFAREVGALSGTIRPVAGSRHDRNMERQPAYIRRAIERAVRASNISWKLLMRRGRLVEEVLALSEPGDCLLLGRVGWSARLGRKLGATPLTLARQATSTVQICSAVPANQRGQVAVLIEDVASAPALMSLAADRARIAARGLVVLVSPSANENTTSQGELLTGKTPECRLRSLATLTTGEMLQALAGERVVELVVRRDGDWLASSAPRRILERLPLTVVVVD